MGEDHHRSLGIVDNSGGIGSSIQEATTSVSLSYPIYNFSRSSQDSASGFRGINAVTESSNRASLHNCSRPRFLFPHFLGAQENWRHETSYRPFCPKHVFDYSPFQNGNQSIYQGFYSPRHVGHLFGSGGCLFPLPHCPSIQEVSSFCLGRQGLPVPGAPFWTRSSAFGVYQTIPNSPGSSSQPIYSNPFLSGRFPFEGIQSSQSQFTHSHSHRAVPPNRFYDILGEVRPDSLPKFHFPRGTLQDRSGSCISHRDQIPISVSVHSVQSEGTISDCSTILTVARSSELPSRCGTSRASSYSPNSVLPIRTLASSLTRLGGSDSSIRPSETSSPLVDIQGERSEGSSPSNRFSQPDIIHRFIQPRLGCISERAHSVRPVVFSATERTHKCPRDEGSLSGSISFQRVSVEQVSCSSNRQFDSGGLPGKSGRNTQLPSIPVSKGYPSILRSTPDCTGSETYSRPSQSSCRFTEPISGSSKHGMGTSQIGLPICSSTLGQAQHRPLRNKSEFQNPDVRVTSSGPQGLRSGCYGNVLGGHVRLRLPSIQVPGSCSKKDREGAMQDHSYCSSLAKTSLVPRSTVSVLCQSSCPSSETQSAVSVQGQSRSSVPRLPSSSRLASVRNNLRQEGFSESAALHISRAVRESTSCVYDAKWSVFAAWCSEKEINTLQITAHQLADFLVYLFEVKGLAPSTIKGYRSAISRTIALSGGVDFGKNEHISLLLRNFSLDRPRQKVLFPQWNLGLVLSYLSSTAFEPVDQIDFSLLTYKCCFLLALASGRRRSEIHALSISDSCLRFTRNRSSVTLLTDPAFLGKNQIPDKGATHIVIPALPDNSDSLALCPVRILTAYLSRSSTIRSGNTRLFIPIKRGVSDLSVKTISQWICKTISMAYQSSGQTFLDQHSIKAHEVRALSNSWALFNSASLNDVLSAGFWRNENSFISHYLRSMTSHADDLFSLGPIVSAQRVNFPPVPLGDSGISSR